MNRFPSLSVTSIQTVCSEFSWGSRNLCGPERTLIVCLTTFERHVTDQLLVEPLLKTFTWPLFTSRSSSIPSS